MFAMTFHSRFYHPNTAPRHIFHSFLLKPFMYGLVALMIISYTMMLQNVDALAFLLWGTAVWYGTISLIIWQYLEKQVATILIQDEFAQITSPLSAHQWKPSKLVTGFRIQPEGAFVNLGETVYEFKRQDWEMADKLFHALEAASFKGANPVWV